VRVLIEGVVNGVRSSKKAAYLQFLTHGEDGLFLEEVKVVGADKVDLLPFKGKKVLLEDVSISSDGFNKYYRVDDISKVKLIEGEKK